MNKHFTLDGSNELEKHLEHVCNEVREQVIQWMPSSRLEAIFLGGGYGRGEGGVLRTERGDRPYNDLEFYVSLRGNPRVNEKLYGHRLHELGEELTHRAGIEVEFKITSFEKLRSSLPSMFLYDLALGHRTLFGSDDILNDPRFRNASEIPTHEATRLLMNRCSGLLFSQEKLARRPFTPDDADFVGRNHAKTQLAFGDVVLTTLGRYHWSCRERSKQLQQLTEAPDLAEFPVPLQKIVCHHQMGVEFKLHPKQMTGTAEEFIPLQTELCEIGRHLWLWLESRRLHKRFASISDYALGHINKCPETNPLKNRLINLKHFGALGFLGSKGARYPRERMLHALSLLLWTPSIQRSTPELVKTQEELNTVSTDFTQLVEAYRSLWRNFN